MLTKLWAHIPLSHSTFDLIGCKLLICCGENGNSICALEFSIEWLFGVCVKHSNEVHFDDPQMRRTCCETQPLKVMKNAAVWLSKNESCNDLWSSMQLLTLRDKTFTAQCEWFGSHGNMDANTCKIRIVCNQLSDIAHYSSFSFTFSANKLFYLRNLTILVDVWANSCSSIEHVEGVQNIHSTHWLMPHEKAWCCWISVSEATLFSCILAVGFYLVCVIIIVPLTLHFSRRILWIYHDVEFYRRHLCFYCLALVQS